MKFYDIKNERVLDILEEFRYTYFEKYDVRNEVNRSFKSHVLNNVPIDYYISDHFRDEVIGLGTSHSGAAEYSYSYAIKPNNLEDRGKTDPYKEDWIKLDEKIKLELGLRFSALSMMYPPDGYIGWHNNANASSYNLVFTYSETGDGWFKFVDPLTGVVNTLQDKKGWSLKAGYFGSYNEPEHIYYHAAWTGCWRMTLSYVLGKDKNYWQDCIDYITEG